VKQRKSGTQENRKDPVFFLFSCLPNSSPPPPSRLRAFAVNSLPPFP
jgi:hypothetical protein